MTAETQADAAGKPRGSATSDSAAGAKRSPRLAALEQLCGVILNQQSLAAEQGMDAGEQSGLVRAMVYGTLRHYESLQFRLSSFLRKPFRKKDQDIEILLLLGLFQLHYLDKPARASINETVEVCRMLNKDWAVKVVNGVLRTALRELNDAGNAPADELDSSAPDTARYCLPSWLLKQLQSDWKEHWRLIAGATAVQAPMTLRVNPLKTTVDDYLQQLTEASITGRALPSVPFGIQLDQACSVFALPGFDDGFVSVQDEAAQLCAALFVDALEQRFGGGRRMLRLLDACAAPGGKTCAVIELLLHRGWSVDMTASDISSHRLQRVHQTLDRLGLDKLAAESPERLQLKVIALDAGEFAAGSDVDSETASASQFDGILIDAPCSGSGVIRRHPDIKLLRRATDSLDLHRQQVELLRRLFTALTADGVLLYATCSVFRQENHASVAALLREVDAAGHIELKDDVLAGVLEQSLPAVNQPGEESSDSSGVCLRGNLSKQGLQLFPTEGGNDGFFYSVVHRI